MLTALLESGAGLRCSCCEQLAGPDGLLCALCRRDLVKRLHPRSLPRQALAPGFELYSFGSFEGSWARFLRVAKSQACGGLDSESRHFLRSLVEYWAPEVARFGAQAVVAVPSHPLRSLLQTDLSAYLAAECARALALPLLDGLLVRRWAGSRAQKTLSRRQRLEASLTPSFHVTAGVERLPPRLLLVDDICTTGASLVAAQRLVLGLQAQHLRAVVFARKPRLC